MKVAYFTESLPPMTDGVSRTLSYLKKTLDSESIDYRFYSPFCQPDSEWRDSVYRFISIPFPLYPRYRVSLPFFHDLGHNLDRFKPDIIHICSPFLSGMAAYGFGENRGIPVVSSFHTRFVSYFEYYGYGRMEFIGWNYLRWFYNRGDITFVPSRNTIGELEKHGFENLALWERGIDTERFSPAFADSQLREKWSPDGRPVALFVGRLVAEKDMDVLLKAHAILKERNIEYRLVIAGAGPLRTRIERFAPDIILTGHLEGDDLSRAYASADFFAFPSITESFGNVILEAAASGLPTVGAAAGGTSDLIRDGENGLLARPKDALDFANKMEEMIKSDSLRNSLGGNAYDIAVKKDWGKINGELIENYKKIVEFRKKDSIHSHDTADFIIEGDRRQ